MNEYISAITNKLYLEISAMYPFVSPYTNKCTEEYGGCAENWARFSKNIINKARALVGSDFIIGYRISAEEGGWWPHSRRYDRL